MAAIYRSIQRCCCPDDTSSGTGSRHQLTQRLMPPKTVEDARSTAAHTPILMPETAGCLTMHLERHPATGRARLRMSVLRDLVTDDAVELLLSYSLRAIHIGEPFLALWDLRQCALPKTSQVGLGTWGGGRGDGDGGTYPTPRLIRGGQAAAFSVHHSNAALMPTAVFLFTLQVWRCIQWGSRHKAALDSRMVSLVVLLGDSNTALRNVVQFVMRITMPAVRVPPRRPRAASAPVPAPVQLPPPRVASRPHRSLRTAA